MFEEEDFGDTRLVKIFIDQKKAIQFKQDKEANFDLEYKEQCEYYSLYEQIEQSFFTNCPTKKFDLEYDTREEDIKMTMKRLYPHLKVPEQPFRHITIKEMESED
jgi:hypothetical protein